MTTIPQNKELLKNLFELLEAHRAVFKQQRVYERVVALVLAEVFAFSRHTVTQLLMTLGMTGEDWSGWYRLFSRGRFDYGRASEVVFEETLRHVASDEVYVVAGDGTQTPRSSRKIEGSGWLRALRTPPFMAGIHAAQRWFHCSWLTPAENGYSRAIPLRWLPAFTAKSCLKAHAPCKEWEAAVHSLAWLREQCRQRGRADQRLLFVGDGHFDNLELWQAVPDGVILLARSAKNRVLYHLPGEQTGRGRPRSYGPPALTPQQVWQQRRGWRPLTLTVRGRERHLQVNVCGPFLRKGAPSCPLMLMVVRGKNNQQTRRQPLPFLVNATRNNQGAWVLPLPVETLLFWAWQRWEIEVCHRELKSAFGLGNKQCWNPQAAVASVQWSAWVYALLLLAGYRTWGLARAPNVPTRWWLGSARWSFNTLSRAFRAALWGEHRFHPLCAPSPPDWAEKEQLLFALRNAAFASARS
jgi:hypothetical protein